MYGSSVYVVHQQLLDEIASRSGTIPDAHLAADAARVEETVQALVEGMETLAMGFIQTLLRGDDPEAQQDPSLPARYYQGLVRELRRLMAVYGIQDPNPVDG